MSNRHLLSYIVHESARHLVRFLLLGFMRHPGACHAWGSLARDSALVVGAERRQKVLVRFAQKLFYAAVSINLVVGNLISMALM